MCQIVWSVWLVCFLGVLWQLSAPKPLASGVSPERRGSREERDANLAIEVGPMVTSNGGV
jgi:hypothetical protein